MVEHVWGGGREGGKVKPRVLQDEVVGYAKHNEREGGREGGEGGQEHTCVRHKGSSPDHVHFKAEILRADTHPCPPELIHGADGR